MKKKRITIQYNKPTVITPADGSATLGLVGSHPVEWDPYWTQNHNPRAVPSNAKVRVKPTSALRQGDKVARRTGSQPRVRIE